jgi:Xaa-Pro aminopeptidase
VTETLFERAEYLRRLTRTRARMEADGIDLLVVTDPSNMFYLSGYDAWSFYVPQALLVPLDGEEPLWVGRGIDVNAARLTAFMGPDRLVGYPDDYVQNAGRHPMTYVASLVQDLGYGDGRIGVETDGYYCSPRSQAALLAGLPAATVVDAEGLVNWVRVVKSPAEVALMRQAARIVEHAMTVAVSRMAPGVRECDVAADIYHALIGGTPEFGGTYASSPPFIPHGERASAPHLSWTDRPYETDRPTTLELVASRNRYHCPSGRTVYLGRPPAEVLRTADVVVEGLTAAVEAVRPGVTCEEIEAVWRRVVAPHGVTKESRMGYSIGIAYPPTFGERTFSVRRGDTTVLEPGMTLHLIPGIWLDRWGIVITEAMVVTETGGEPFCTLPRELLVVT